MDDNSENIQTSTLKRISLWFKKRLLTILVALMVLIMLILFFYRDIFITIYAGHAGVLFERFGDGTKLDKAYPEGTYMVFPWNQMYIYDVRMQERTDSMTVISNNGLAINLVVSVRFFPSLSTLGILHRYIGPNYVEKVVMPEIEAKTRDIISKFDPVSLYSLNREKIQDSISKRVLESINSHKIVRNILTDTSPNYVVFENLYIEHIELPDFIVASIERKLDAEQKSLQYDYMITSTQKEAERRRIEAGGIADFRSISGIDILKWRGVEATEKLATSNNAKIIIMGTDKLPVLLNGDSSIGEVKVKTP